MTDSPAPPEPRRPLDLAVAAGAVIALLVGWFGNGDAPRPLGFPLDDSWIHMVYGRSLALEGLLAYNTAVPATGATSPLWAMLVAIAHLLGTGSIDRTVVIVYLLGAALHVACAVLVARVTRGITSSAASGLVAGLAVALSGPLALSAFSGMEVGLAATLLVAAVLACTRHAWGWAGLWLALAALARPEAVAVSVICFAFVALTTQQASPRARLAALVQLTWPSALLGALTVSYAMWATGRPLPATFYMKQTGGLADLPARLRVALGSLLSDVPPLRTPVMYLALLGSILSGYVRRGGSRAPQLLPLAAAAGFLVANLAMIDPRPGAFYHLRYLLPAVPLLIAALVVGARELGCLAVFSATRWRRSIPLGIFGALALVQSATTICATSRRLHNDTRNIEEVQRALGRWINAHTSADTWIATGDAGAVRYFGQRPTVDVMGLNTPELYWQPAWNLAHPLAAFVMIPCWFRQRDGEPRVVTTARTENYSVTTVPCMKEQVVVSCNAPARLHFVGVRAFTLSCDPAGLLLEPSP